MEATMDPSALAAIRAEVQRRRPMIHHITNNVVTNFTANVTLALGASPVMAACAEEAADMVAYAGCLLLNMGTLFPAQIESMILAGRRANALGVPVVFDPVGMGATPYRTASAARILNEVQVAVVRANAGEVLALAGAADAVRGVDAREGLDGADQVATFAEVARGLGAVVAVTGATDLVTDGRRVARSPHGHPLMGQVTGTGCGATTAVACCMAVEPRFFEATVAALAVYGLAGERAGQIAAGPGTFVPLFLDELAGMSEVTLREALRVEEAAE